MMDDLFGSLFDFNGDGTTDISEEAVGYAILEDIMKDEECSDDNDLGLDDYDE